MSCQAQNYIFFCFLLIHCSQKIITRLYFTRRAFSLRSINYLAFMCSLEFSRETRMNNFTRFLGVHSCDNVVLMFNFCTGETHHYTTAVFYRFIDLIVTMPDYLCPRNKYDLLYQFCWKESYKPKAEQFTIYKREFSSGSFVHVYYRVFCYSCTTNKANASSFVYFITVAARKWKSSSDCPVLRILFG